MPARLTPFDVECIHTADGRQRGHRGDDLRDEVLGKARPGGHAFRVVRIEMEEAGNEAFDLIEQGHRLRGDVLDRSRAGGCGRISSVSVCSGRGAIGSALSDFGHGIPSKSHAGKPCQAPRGSGSSQFEPALHNGSAHAAVRVIR